MKLVNAAALVVALAATTYAYGDAIVSGAVSNTDLSGSVCSSAASSSASVSLNCGSGAFTDGLAQVNAAVDPLDASMQVFLASYENPMAPGMSTVATANLSWTVDGTYVFAGGSGYGYIYWVASAYRFGEGGGGLFGPCTITLDGVTEACDLNAGFASGSFLVPYNTPVTLIFDASYSAAATNFDAVYSGMDLDIDGLKPVDPSTTPEPPTWALVALGMIAICGVRMRSSAVSALTHRVANRQR